MEIPLIQNLLTHTSLIAKRHQEIARVNGSDFNLFNILGVGHLEVSTHSSLIGDLLNPRGSHGQGASFLEKFLNLESVNDPGIDPDTTSIFLEYHIGNVTEVSGGRIDVLLRDGKGKQLAIENKIYANDQPNWVRRYLNFLGFKPEDFSQKDKAQCASPLYYLTLHGSEPATENSAEKAAVHCISYQTDIINWLKECRKEAVGHPLVRESITQYIHLLHNLTGQNSNQKMNTEIVNLVLKDAENFEATNLLIESQGAIYDSLVQRLKSQLNKHFSTKPDCDLELLEWPFLPHQKEQGFFFNNSKIVSRGIYITIHFDGAHFTGCRFGFSFSEQNLNYKNPSDFEIALNKQFKQQFAEGLPINDWWINSTRWQQHQNWDQQVFKEILSDQETFAVKIIELVESLAAIIPDEAETEQLTETQS